MHKFQYFFIICLLWAQFRSSLLTADAIAQPRIHLNISITPLKKNSLKIKGSVDISNWQPKSNRRCLYLPYESTQPSWQKNTFRHIESLNIRPPNSNSPANNRSTFLNKNTLNFRKIKKDIFEIIEDSSKKSTRISFHSLIEQNLTNPQKSFVLDGFYPIPLPECPPSTATEPAMYLRMVHSGRLNDSIEQSIKPTYAWHLISALTYSPSFVGSRLPIIISTDTPTLWLTSGTKKIHIIGDQGRRPLKETLTKLLPFLESNLSQAPFKNLLIFYTHTQPSQSLPGIITIRPPRQVGLKTIQSNYLNWEHWALVSLVASQWYGVSISESAQADRWLVDGINDYVTGLFFSEYPTRNNLFNSYETDFSLLSFTFQQIQDITASVLATRSKTFPLTENSKSTKAFNIQNPLLFIRHSVAMRHLHHILGDKNFRKFMNTMTQTLLGHTLNPQRFIEILKEFASSQLNANHFDLNQWQKWWTTGEWPDYQLINWSTEKTSTNLWTTHAAISASEMTSSPIHVEIRNQEGLHTLTTTSKRHSNGLLYATINSPFRPDSLHVNPKRMVFEVNRFNNNSNGPNLKFLPGSASTLHDSHFTAIWLPHAMRRPGDPFAIGFQSAIFKHVQSDLFALAAIAPENYESLYRIAQNIYVKSDGIRFALSIDKNFRGLQVSEAQLERYLDLDWPISLHSSIALRNKRILGLTETNHQSIAFLMNGKNATRDGRCQFNLASEVEYAPESLTSGFQYTRMKGLLSSHCQLSGSIYGSMRLFRGIVDGSGRVPSEARFYPTDLKEAGLHIDQRGLSFADDLNSASINLYFPIGSLFPSDATYIVRNDMQLRTFYDIGYSSSSQTDLSSYGLGIVLPFGGDIMGAGTLTFTKFSALVIVRSRINSKYSNKPSFIFNLSGDL